MFESKAISESLKKLIDLLNSKDYLSDTDLKLIMALSKLRG